MGSTAAWEAAAILMTQLTQSFHRNTHQLLMLLLSFHFTCTTTQASPSTTDKATPVGVGIWKPKALKAASFWWKISPQATVFSFLCLKTTHIFSKKKKIKLTERFAWAMGLSEGFRSRNIWYPLFGFEG